MRGGNLCHKRIQFNSSVNSFLLSDYFRVYRLEDLQKVMTSRFHDKR